MKIVGPFKILVATENEIESAEGLRNLFNNRLRETVSSRWDLFMRKPPNFLLGGASPFYFTMPHWCPSVTRTNRQRASPAASPILG